jgi:hypothetical protein
MWSYRASNYAVGSYVCAISNGNSTNDNRPKRYEGTGADLGAILHRGIVVPPAPRSGMSMDERTKDPGPLPHDRALANKATDHAVIGNGSFSAHLCAVTQ